MKEIIKIFVLKRVSVKNRSKDYFFLIFLIVIIERYKTKATIKAAPNRNNHFINKNIS